MDAAEGASAGARTNTASPTSSRAPLSPTIAQAVFSGHPRDVGAQVSNPKHSVKMLLAKVDTITPNAIAVVVPPAGKVTLPNGRQVGPFRNGFVLPVGHLQAINNLTKLLLLRLAEAARIEGLHPGPTPLWPGAASRAFLPLSLRKTGGKESAGGVAAGGAVTAGADEESAGGDAADDAVTAGADEESAGGDAADGAVTAGAVEESAGGDAADTDGPDEDELADIFEHMQALEQPDMKRTRPRWVLRDLMRTQIYQLEGYGFEGFVVQITGDTLIYRCFGRGVLSFCAVNEDFLHVALLTTLVAGAVCRPGVTVSAAARAADEQVARAAVIPKASEWYDKLVPRVGDKYYPRRLTVAARDAATADTSGVAVTAADDVRRAT